MPARSVAAVSDSAAFVVLGVVALVLGWPAWAWIVAFVLAALSLPFEGQGRP